MVLVERDVVTPEFCAAVRRAMDAGVADAADVLAGDFVHDDSARRALEIDIDRPTLALVEAHLESLRLRLESFFHIQLDEREGAGLLRYRAGGYYAPHRDRADVPAWPGAARRRVAVILFLNTSREGDPAGEFSGGTLRVFDEQGSAIEIVARAGTLAAFPADTLHEVTVVRDGTRDAVVDWFYGAP